jgi:hypothetical protein
VTLTGVPAKIGSISVNPGNPIVEEVLRFEDLPPGSLASRRAIVRWSDGTEGEALRFYSDEVLISEGDHGNSRLMSPRAEMHRAALFGPRAEGLISRAELAMRACRARRGSRRRTQDARASSRAGLAGTITACPWKATTRCWLTPQSATSARLLVCSKEGGSLAGLLRGR